MLSVVTNTRALVAGVPIVTFEGVLGVGLGCKRELSLCSKRLSRHSISRLRALRKTERVSCVEKSNARPSPCPIHCVAGKNPFSCLNTTISCPGPRSELMSAV